jgi:hypothetical protein
VTLALGTYGTALDSDRSNGILVCHAFEWQRPGVGRLAVDGDSDGIPGWWEGCLGQARPWDADRLFVLCCHDVIGSCYRVDRTHEHRRPKPASPTDSTSPSTTVGADTCAGTGRAARPPPRELTACSAWPAARWGACRCWNGPATTPHAAARRHSDRHHRAHHQAQCSRSPSAK